MSIYPPGIYYFLHTVQLDIELIQAGQIYRGKREMLEPEGFRQRLAILLYRPLTIYGTFYKALRITNNFHWRSIHEQVAFI